MEYKDYYKILGLDKSANADQIRKAFRDLAKKYHPDKNPNNKSSEEKFKQINEAYEVLKDPEKKKRYDELGSSWKNYADNGGRQSDFDWNQWANQSQSRSSSGGNFSDFFESIFGGGFSGAGAGSRRTRSFRGEDLQAVMDVNLEEVLKGTQRIVNLNGQSIKLKIKPGVRNDQVLRMKGKGSPGRNGGESGDLLITIRVLNHPVFTVKGNDLYTDLYVDVLTAILGGKVTLNTLDKPVSITIPEGTDSGKTLRLKGAGIPEYGSIDKRGELYVRILVRVPKSLSQKEKELYMELKRIKDSGLVNS